MTTVNLHIDTSFLPQHGQTKFKVEVYVHPDEGLMRDAILYEEIIFAQQPHEDMNLNLWATSIVRGLAARMEETFIYVDQRPQAILMKDTIEPK